MADYQSLLTRAVANLSSTNSTATRQAIYDRARKALLTQLRTLRPPLPESDIAREENALNQAIALVEAKFGGTDAAHAEPTPAKTASSAPAPPAAAERPTAAAAPRPAPVSQPTGSASAPTIQSQSATAAPSPPAVPARTAAAPAASGAAARAAAPAVSTSPALQRPPTAGPPAGAAQPRTESARAPAPASAQQNTPAGPVRPAQAPSPSVVNPAETRAFQGVAATKAPPLRADRASQPGGTASVAAPMVAAKTEGSSAASSNLAKVVPSAEAHAGGSAAPPVVARIEDGAELGSAPEVPIDDDRLAPRLEPEGQRPQAPTAPAEKSKSWLWLGLAVVLGAVLSVAGAAIVMRQKPQDLAIAPPEAQQEASAQPPAKIAQRAQPSPAEGNSTAPAASEPQGGQSTAQSGQEPANPAPEADNGTLPGAARAAMLIASPDNPQKPVVNLGSTVWSTIPPAPGQPATVAVKADADIPDLKMHASMTLRKNTDPTLQATHTIDLKFSFADGAPIAGFKDVGAPQMRKLDSTASEALTSVKVKVSDVYFLIALAKGDQDTARNLDLMQTRAWFDFPLLLNDNRIAKLVFQKSSEGEAMLAKAFDAWK
ncbi:MAG TPA: hypothetical protein VKG91_12015 [Roseiarcus sp.]|nr:hypothetical protein [Roseiarcus sp.]